MTRKVFAAALAGVIIGGCGSPLKLDSQERRTAEPFAWSGAIDSGDALEIKGVHGTVRAVAANGDQARVTAVRSGRRNDPAAVEVVVVQHAGGVTICAVYPGSPGRSANSCEPGDEGRIGARNNDVTVDFTVEVPGSVDFVGKTTNGDVVAERLAGNVEVYSTNGDVEINGGRSARARTTNGSVTIETEGAADARTTNGEILARMGSLDGSEPLSFSTTNGGIRIGLPASANVSIDASTTNGRIVSDLPVTIQGSVSRNRLAGTIGNGGREITLRTTNGSIELERGS